MSAVTHSSARGIDVDTSSANTCNAPVCAKCQDPVAGPVVKFWMRGDPIDLCVRCSLAPEFANNRWNTGLYPENLRSLRCEGCGREIRCELRLFWMISRQSSHNWQKTAFCGDACRRFVVNGERRHARAAARGVMDCAQCTKAFEPARADVRYCSSACRQKAYRLRKAVAA